jgi:2-polyprenyl-3-methyl-5-hydroxy-6-metoxy-1,4-benzoquinol methylase
MDKNTKKNKEAWEYRAYEFAVKNNGMPSECAIHILKNPIALLKTHAKYFNKIGNLRIANLCGSSGRRAVALAALGADVTVFDISSENKRYAEELAAAANVKLDYVVSDVLVIDSQVYTEYFDKLYLEGGILHYFHDIDKLMKKLSSLLKPDGEIILNDFHPFRKVMPINYFKSTVDDYFDKEIHKGDLAYKDLLDEIDGEVFPDCSLRYYNLSEIINSMIKAGFMIVEFNEEPSWTDKKLPGEITIHARKIG